MSVGFARWVWVVRSAQEDGLESLGLERWWQDRLVAVVRWLS